MKHFVATLLAVSLSFTGLFGQQTLTEKAETLHHHERSMIKKPTYEFLKTWNPSADLIKPAQKELNHKIKQNKQKRKDPNKGTAKLRDTYEQLVAADGTERSFLAESFAVPMLHELKIKGLSLKAEEIYTAQYVIKYTLGVPKFNHGELDVDNHDQMEEELASLIGKYPNNDAHDQEIDGHVIDIFTEEATTYFNMFVKANQTALENGQGKSTAGPVNLTGMSCGEKYEYLKKQGIMH